MNRDSKGKFIKGHKAIGKPFLKGHLVPKEWRENLSKTKKGKPSNRKGVKVSLESRKRMSISNIGIQSGNKHPNWQGGKTPLAMKIRNSIEYKLWRISVFERDNYICRFCGQVGGKLNADHIKSFSLYPEFRLAIDNGRTLCIDCHKKTPTFAGNSMRKV